MPPIQPTLQQHNMQQNCNYVVCKIQQLQQFQSPAGSRHCAQYWIKPAVAAVVMSLLYLQMYEEAEEFEDSLMAFRDLLVDFESATDGKYLSNVNQSKPRLSRSSLELLHSL